jgi:hypothetical protein
MSHPEKMTKEIIRERLKRMEAEISYVEYEIAQLTSRGATPETDPQLRRFVKHHRNLMYLCNAVHIIMLDEPAVHVGVGPHNVPQEFLAGHLYD